MRAMIVIACLLAFGGFVYLASKATGPRFYNIRLGEVSRAGSNATKFTLRGPNKHAWFGYFNLVVRNGRLSPDDAIDIEVVQEGKTVYHDVFSYQRLIQMDGTQRSFVIQPSNKQTLGHGKQFEVTAKFLSASEARLEVYAKFVDDRLFKPSKEEK
jgi:hypothetical protein